MLVTRITGHLLQITEAPGTWKEHAKWQILTPDQVNMIVSNPTQKNVINPGQQGFDINGIWCVNKETDESLKERRVRGLKHPQFMSYVETRVSAGYTFVSYLNFLKNMGHVSKDYQSYKLLKKKENDHEVIKEVAISISSQKKGHYLFQN